MGNWYTNICVKGAQQSDVIAALNELGRRAYVTPDIGGWIVLYDHECDKFDLDLLESLALTISSQLACITFASFNADDDMLWLGAYESGKLTTRYSSERRQFEDADEFPPIDSVASVLCRIFGKPEKVPLVRRILRRGHGALGLFSLIFKIRLAYVVEVLRHGDLAEALGIPSGSVGFGYEYVNRGETPPDMKREALQRTLNG
jgi:hypothetical protein